MGSLKEFIQKGRNLSLKQKTWQASLERWHSMAEKIETGLIQSWVVDAFRPEDAESVVALYYEIYGDQYPVKAVYDPQELIRQSAGDAYRVVARTETGEVVGHLALYRSSPPNTNLYEQGQLMVRKDYRRTNIVAEIAAYSMEVLPARYGLEQLWGEAVCNHLVTQQLCARAGFYATALEVDLMPAEAYAKAFSRPSDDTGRVATLVVFWTFKAKPQRIYLPEVYEDTLRQLYAVHDFGHSFTRSQAGLAAGISTRGKTDIFSGPGVARVTLFEAGEDFPAYLQKTEQQARAEGAVVFQVYYPLSQPCVGAVVDVLRSNGYFLGGFLPRWYDDDGLLMQKVLSEPNFAGIHLYTKHAKAILEIIKQDWLSTRAGEESEGT
jgi:GNAT superfamily N-acetyltransferase